jgi:hypothetical protein
MARRRRFLSALAVVALLTTGEIAHADPTPASGEAAAPAYTLDVVTDAPDVVSYEALAARLAAELGAPVARIGAAPPTRAAITVQYFRRTITVHAVHAGGRGLERTVKAEGDDAAVQSEVVLLAANLARDEARELLDDLAARPAPPPPPAATPAPAPAAPPPPPPAVEGEDLVTVAMLYPLATNAGRPNVASWVDASIFYGRVGTIRALQLGAGVVQASREVTGAQIGGFGTVAGGRVTGARVAGMMNLGFAGSNDAAVAGAGNVTLGDVRGVHVAGATNVVGGALSGAAIAAGANVVLGRVEGAELSAVNVAGDVDGAQIGLVNVGRKIRGLQIGLVNVAEEVDGAAIGLVSVNRDSVHPIVWTSNKSYTNVGVKFRTKYVYTVAALTYGNPELDWTARLGSYLGLGVRVPLPYEVDTEVEGGYANVSTTRGVTEPGNTAPNANAWVHVRGLVGYSFAKHLRVFAGAGARIPVDLAVGRPVTAPEVLGGVQF